MNGVSDPLSSCGKILFIIYILYIVFYSPFLNVEKFDRILLAFVCDVLIGVPFASAPFYLPRSSGINVSCAICVATYITGSLLVENGAVGRLEEDACGVEDEEEVDVLAEGRDEEEKEMAVGDAVPSSSKKRETEIKIKTEKDQCGTLDAENVRRRGTSRKTVLD
jgi:hypothetical protein